MSDNQKPIFCIKCQITTEVLKEDLMAWEHKEYTYPGGILFFAQKEKGVKSTQKVVFNEKEMVIPIDYDLYKISFRQIVACLKATDDVSKTEAHLKDISWKKLGVFFLFINQYSAVLVPCEGGQIRYTTEKVLQTYNQAHYNLNVCFSNFPKDAIMKEIYLCNLIANRKPSFPLPSQKIYLTSDFSNAIATFKK